MFKINHHPYLESLQAYAARIVLASHSWASDPMTIKLSTSFLRALLEQGARYEPLELEQHVPKGRPLACRPQPTDSYLAVLLNGSATALPWR